MGSLLAFATSYSLLLAVVFWTIAVGLAAIAFLLKLVEANFSTGEILSREVEYWMKVFSAGLAAAGSASLALFFLPFEPLWATALLLVFALFCWLTFKVIRKNNGEPETRKELYERLRSGRADDNDEWLATVIEPK